MTTETKRCEAAVDWACIDKMRQCKRRATKTVNGRPVCKQHSNLEDRGAICLPKEYRDAE